MALPAGGPSILWRLGSRPCRRTLLVSLWFCMVYGVFHFIVFKDQSARGLEPSGVAGSSGIYEANRLFLGSSGFQQFGNIAESSFSGLTIGPASPSSSSSSASQSPYSSSIQSSSSQLSSSLPSQQQQQVPIGVGEKSQPIISTSKLLGWADESEPKIDKGTKSIEELILDAASTIRNIPLPPYILAKEKGGPKYFRNASCARFPTIYDLEFSNTYWQTLRTSNGTIHLYGAYFDIRTRNRLGPSLRILGMMDRIEPNVTSYCQIWFAKEKEPIFSKVLEYKYIWFSKWGNFKQGIFQPYLLACQVPKSHHKKIPASVSLVEKPCHHANNNMRVIFDKPEKKQGFAVCVKGLDFLHEDLSVRLIEWIELLGILGANKIFFYELAVHPNITKVLRYYQGTGQIDVTPLTLPGGQPNDPRIRHIYLGKKVNHKRQNEVIPYNDCLYRNLYQYEYVALLDIDEVIMPINAPTWKELMVEVDRKARLSRNDSRASYNFRNIYFLDDMMHGHTWFPQIPRYFHMLQHVYRSRNFTKPGQYVKCFHNPERVITLHNHFPLACLNGSCTSYPVGTEYAQLQHYRADCVRALKNCDKEYKQHSVLDTTIWRYKDLLIEKASKVLRTLGFIPQDPVTHAQPQQDSQNVNLNSINDNTDSNSNNNNFISNDHDIGR